MYAYICIYVCIHTSFTRETNVSLVRGALYSECGTHETSRPDSGLGFQVTVLDLF